MYFGPLSLLHPASSLALCEYFNVVVSDIDKKSLAYYYALSHARAINTETFLSDESYLCASYLTFLLSSRHRDEDVY